MSKTPTYRSRLLVFSISLGVALLTAEVGLRALDPGILQTVRRDLSWFARGPNYVRRIFTLDPELGYRPVLDNDYYGPHGALRNPYELERDPGVRRVLFIGDSVTRRGQLVAGVRAQFGTEAIEYWNAGVESFNTLQEVRFYERYNTALEPDHVVLTFHLNDFEATPAAFFDEEGKLRVAAWNTAPDAIHPRLYEACYLYRWFVATRRPLAQRAAPQADEVRAALKRLHELLERRGAQLTVLVHPILKPVEEWRAEEREAHRRILTICSELELSYFDLLPAMKAALAQGIEVQHAPGDSWHPSSAAGATFARWLAEQGWRP